MSEFTAFEHAGWALAADAYENGFLPLTRQAIPSLLDAVALRSGERLLDEACGPGDLAAEAAARGARVTATDFSDEMLAIASRRHPGIVTRREDAQTLSFADASFDAVTMGFLLGHLDDPAQALAEAHRVLAPGGRFAASWWQGFDRAVVFGYLFGAVRDHGRADVGLPPGPPFDQFSDRAALEDALRAAGFTDVRVVEAPLVWRPASGEEAFHTFTTSGVRSTAVLSRQTPEALEAIRRALLAKLVPFATPAGLAIPTPAWVVSGTKR